MPLIDYKLSVIKKGYDISKTEDKRKYVSEALGVIRTADSEAEREELLKQLRTQSGISFEALKRDLQSKPIAKESAETPPPVRRDGADSIKKASRFVIASYLFGADYTADTHIEDVSFKDEVHTVIAGYIRSKSLMNEAVRVSEIFEFFDKGTAEYEELDRILDNSEGGGFTDAVAEKYFFDCLKKLQLADIDEKIAEQTKKLNGVEDLAEQAKIAQSISQLTRRKAQIINGNNRP